MKKQTFCDVCGAHPVETTTVAVSENDGTLTDLTACLCPECLKDAEPIAPQKPPIPYGSHCDMCGSRWLEDLVQMPLASGSSVIVCRGCVADAVTFARFYP